MKLAGNVPMNSEQRLSKIIALLATAVSRMALEQSEAPIKAAPESGVESDIAGGNHEK